MKTREDVEAQVRIELASVMTWCHNHPGVVSTSILNQSVDSVLAVLDVYVAAVVASVSDVEAEDGPKIQEQRRQVLAATDGRRKRVHDA